MSKIVFSGIQPTGNLHIGNYIGAVKQWASMQTDDSLNTYCIVDLHAITVAQDPDILREKILDMAAIILAAGVDPEKSLLFVQSHNPDHANLAWVLNCFTSMGQLNRMTQYKEKSDGKEFVSVGLFDYPVLMAADILLYDTTHVPVGDDQKQHVELARDIAERFNAKYGQTFVVPQPVIPVVGARIMSLQNPDKKMSKSDSDVNATIGLMDTPDMVSEKIARAVTDSERTIAYDPSRPAIFNLVEIYAQLSGQQPGQIEKMYEGKGYKEFKAGLVETINGFLAGFQSRFHEYRNPEKLESILRSGARRAYAQSHIKLLHAYTKIGFVHYDYDQSVSGN